MDPLLMSSVVSGLSPSLADDRTSDSTHESANEHGPADTYLQEDLFDMLDPAMYGDEFLMQTATQQEDGDVPMGQVSPMEVFQTPSEGNGSQFGEPSPQYGMLAGLSSVDGSLYDPASPSDELKRYQESKNDLMKMKFGMKGGKPSKDLEDVKPETSALPDSPEFYKMPIPAQYLTGVSSDSLPFTLRISDLPTCSRVETQIKLKLSVSPAPAQFLLHIPRDTVAKSKLTLQDPEIPESVRPKMLFLDTFVVGASTSADLSQTRSFNVCRRCMRRELKRASRRKSGVAEESCGWNINKPKRAIIFNCKEVLSFPQPTSGMTSERCVEILSRIVCYCRHHQEPNGFRLLFVLKDHMDNVVGRTFSDPIMIMDRKKSLKCGAQTASPPSLQESSSDVTGSSISTATTAPVVVDESRPAKRQKRPWSPSDKIPAATYFDSVTHKRAGSRPQGSFSSVSVKKEPISPLSSDALSPQNNPYASASSATSIFSTTPDKKGISGVSPRQMAVPRAPSSVSSTNSSASSSNAPPAIQRIIPAQGPIRGGIEVTLLGSNFRPGMGVKFGANLSLATHCWSDSTLVTYLPPAAQAGPVLVTIQDNNGEPIGTNAPAHQIFTYTDDSDRQLIELALQIVGLKMNGKLEDAKNIAKRIIGNNHDRSPGEDAEMSTTTTSHMASAPPDSSWLNEATVRMTQLCKAERLGHEKILLSFLSLLDLPNSPVVSPNWAICTLEGQTLLHMACLRGYFKLARYLIEHGAKVDPRDSNDLTPLHYALIQGHRELIVMLIRCKASVATRLGSGVLLEDIADPNVLDLLDQHTLSRERSIDSLSSLLDESSDAEVGSVTRMVVSRNISDSELADSEDNTDYSDGEEPLEVVESSSSGSKVEKKQSIGLGFWMAMRDVFGTRPDADTATITAETVTGETATVVDDLATVVDSHRESEGNDEEEEELPSYDDLFPNGGAGWRSLIGFRGHDTKPKRSQLQAPKPQEATSSAQSSDVELPRNEEEEVEDAIISFKAQQKLKADKRLMFFWMPFLLLLLFIVVGSHLNLIQFSDFQRIAHGLDRARDSFGELMLGRDRFTKLLNDNLNFGRERVGKVLGDMNDAVLTAVRG